MKPIKTALFLSCKAIENLVGPKFDEFPEWVRNDEVKGVRMWLDRCGDTFQLEISFFGLPNTADSNGFVTCFTTSYTIA